MPTDPLSDLTDRLRVRLAANLPGPPAQLTMAPSHRDHLLRGDIAWRDAAVLALVLPSPDGPNLLFTLRPDHLNHHGGQVSFPGGRRDPGETLLQTALRETNEELGIDPTEIQILGALSPLLVPPSRFCVYPFVGVLRHRPVFNPSPDEVAAIIEIRVDRLCDPRIRKSEPRTLRGHEVQIPFFDIAGRKIWGATAMMLAELLAVCQTPSAVTADSTIFRALDSETDSA